MYMYICCRFIQSIYILSSVVIADSLHYFLLHTCIFSCTKKKKKILCTLFNFNVTVMQVHSVNYILFIIT